MIKAVHSLFFSATGSTAKVAIAVSETAASKAGTPCLIHDVTTPEARIDTIEFEKGDLVIFAVPVYIGRMPNLIKPWLSTVKGNGAYGIPIVVFGNRAYDDALVELFDMMTENGFVCTAAAAFIGEHSFSKILGAGRPDAEDLEKAKTFGVKVAELSEPLRSELPGRRPYQFYKALDDNGHPFDIRKAKPVTDTALCCNCGLCSSLCPMGSISKEEPSIIDGICIKCGACVKRCPSGAKHFEDKEYLRHLAILERNFSAKRKEPELFF